MSFNGLPAAFLELVTESLRLLDFNMVTIYQSCFAFHFVYSLKDVFYFKYQTVDCWETYSVKNISQIFSLIHFKHYLVWYFYTWYVYRLS